MDGQTNTIPMNFGMFDLRVLCWDPVEVEGRRMRKF